MNCEHSMMQWINRDGANVLCIQYSVMISFWMAITLNGFEISPLTNSPRFKMNMLKIRNNYSLINTCTLHNQLMIQVEHIQIIITAIKINFPKICSALDLASNHLETILWFERWIKYIYSLWHAKETPNHNLETESLVINLTNAENYGAGWWFNQLLNVLS